MALWKRLFGGGQGSVPDWASFFSPAEHTAFRIEVEEYLRRHGFEYRMGDGVFWMVPPGGDAVEQFGLQNLAQVCHQVGQPGFAEVIRNHFDSMWKGRDDRDTAEALSDDLERALPYLKLRLYRAEMLERTGADLVSREVAPGLAAVLCFDLPQTVATVGPNALQSWGVSLEDLWEPALSNVRGEPGVSRTDQALAGGSTIAALTGDSFFTASRLLALEDSLDTPSSFGALVSVPHRHALLFHPIVDTRVFEAIAALLPMTRGMHAEGPGSISPELYWWRPGRIDLLPSDLTGGKLTFQPPPDFVSHVLERVAEPN